MHLITTTEALEEAVSALAKSDFVTVDTEFIRETTFWPELCLIQMASPDHTALVDALAPGLDLAPFFRLMADEKIVKVFHAARQDIEIVFHLGNLIPRQSSTVRSRRWSAVSVMRFPTTSLSRRSPASTSTSRRDSPTGVGGRFRKSS